MKTRQPSPVLDSAEGEVDSVDRVTGFAAATSCHPQCASSGVLLFRRRRGLCEPAEDERTLWNGVWHNGGAV